MLCVRLLFTLVLGRAISAGAYAQKQMHSSRAAIAQLRSTSDKLLNLLNVAKCAGWAKREGAAMLFLPECFGFLGENGDQTVRNAEPVEGTNESEIVCGPNLRAALTSTVMAHAEGMSDEAGTFDADSVILKVNGGDVSLLGGLRTIAQESGLWISGGGMHESGAPPASCETPGDNSSNVRPRVYNTHVIIDNSGDIRCLYRKIHLFDVSIPGKVSLRESATTAPGEKLVVCDTPVGRLGLSTCYDVRFPEMYVDLVQRGGAEILLVPSAFTVPTGRAHWHTLLRARAIEHQTYVLAAAQFGRHNEKRESYGHSLAVDPWGGVVSDAGGCDGEGTAGVISERPTAPCAPSIIICDVEHDKIRTTRERIPVQSHRDTSVFDF
mmetsp:Transcript_62772/g.185382  ORF Transcript_62772/g.185382 Transcript_62772/m.185382 type:complete len:381 (-) Transcript_62772:78-1220(-)